MLFPLPAKTFDERGNIFCSPDRGSGAEFHGFGITPGPAAFPPGALAYGNHAENLRKTQKAVSGNGRLMLFHKKSPESVWISGDSGTRPKIPVRESDGKRTGNSQKDGKTAGWSRLDYGVCLRFLEEHIHQIAIGFVVPVLFARKQTSHMRLSALRSFVTGLGFLGTTPVQENISDD